MNSGTNLLKTTLFRLGDRRGGKSRKKVENDLHLANNHTTTVTLGR